MKKMLLGIAILCVFLTIFSVISCWRVLLWLIRPLFFGYSGHVIGFRIVGDLLLYVSLAITAIGALRLQQWARKLIIYLGIYGVISRMLFFYPLLRTGETSIFKVVFFYMIPYLFLIWFFARRNVKEQFEKRDSVISDMNLYVRRIVAVLLLTGSGYIFASFLYALFLRACVDLICVLMCVLILLMLGVIIGAAALWGWERKTKVFGITSLLIGIFYLLGSVGLLFPGVIELLWKGVPQVAVHGAQRGMVASLLFIIGGIFLIRKQSKLDKEQKTSK